MSVSEGEPRVLTAVGDRTAGNAPAAADDGAFDASLVSLVLRGDKLPLRNAVSSCFNAATQRLVVVTAPALFLYGHLLELGGEMLGVIAADENVQFQHAAVLPWLDAYSVIAVNLNGHIEHRVVSADFNEYHLTHVIAERGPLYSAVVNPFRREVITADADGGFKVWVIRATTAPNSTKTSWKGFQRIHAGSRKTSYSHMFLAGDDQTILACTKTRIHAFDSTTCAQIGTFYKDTSHTIVRVAFDRENDIIYLQILESPRFVYRLRGSHFRGRINSLETDGIFDGGDDIAAFEVVRGKSAASSAIQPTNSGIFVLDAMGRLVLGSCATSDVASKPDQRSLSLPVAPSAESYVVIHVQALRHESRSFAIVVCASGLVVVEVVLPETSMPARRVLTNVAGTKVAMLDTKDQRRIAIFNSVPPSLLLFDETKTDTFFAILLQLPVSQPKQHPDSAVRSDPTVNSVVDFAGLRHGVVVVWLSGDVTRYCLRTERTITVGRVGGTPVVVQSTAPWGGLQDEWVFVGDDRGTMAVWVFHMDDMAALVCTKSVHSQRLLSISVIKGDSANRSICVVTVAIDGEAKLWCVHALDDRTVTWELLVRFRTYATALSATAFMDPEFLFCASEEGGLECWRFPIIPSTHSREDRLGRGHVAVLKRPLHSIDLHLTRVCQVIVEPGNAAQRVSSAQPQSDEFAWVITYDSDHIVLVWCFSNSFLFPHRKLRPHTIPVGGFMSAVDHRSFRFYAYLGRCLDCIDVVADLDKTAVKRRLTKARDPDSGVAKNMKHVQIDSTESRGIARQRTEELDSSVTAHVRLQITLPSVANVDALADLEANRRSSPQKLQRTKLTRELAELPSDTIKPSTSDSEDSTHDDDARWSERLALSPSPISTEVISRTILGEEKHPLRGVRSSHSTQRPGSSYAPDTVPSQFQRAKPRVYRSNYHPVQSANQSRCTIVTSNTKSDTHQPSTSKSATMDCRQQTCQFLDEETQHQQDRVAIVSVTDDGLTGHLRLDFRSTRSSKRKSIRSEHGSNEREGENWQASVYFITWSSLGVEGQLAELASATRSRFVVQEASEAKLSLPTRDDFSSGDVKAQLRVRAFSRWYLSAQHTRQRVREAFLREELRFAAQDAFVNMAVKSSGCKMPQKSEVDDDTSPDWISFTAWYATGSPLNGDTTVFSAEDATKRMTNRLQERTSFLNKRLESLETTVLGDERSSSLVSDGSYIFDIPQMSDGGTGSGVGVASWKDQSIECRQRELVLALNDRMIQVAAIADGIELPDIAVMKIENVNALSLAALFGDWWGSPSNVYRQDFLNQELLEAANDEGVREALQKTDEEESKTFQERYFRSGWARERFLTQKLQLSQRQIHIDEIFHSGKQAAPVLLESLQAPMFVPFRFPVAAAHVSEGADATLSQAEVLEQESEGEDEVAICELSTTCEDGELDDEWRRQGEEHALMAVEDTLSQQLNDGYESASEDEQEEVERLPLEPPKRTDFTNSYFFGNLPKTFRINAGGWLAGSGIDNGDEEVEEEERLERERQHQEMLDRLEAERIAEAERQAERLRIEKEMDEKALQMRRLRQVELKKILVHQAEVEARRLEHDEHQNMLRELTAMEAEELAMKAWLAFLDSQRAAMEVEDRLAARIALAERVARRDEVRRMLAETTQMDAEDRRSAIAQAEYLELERKKRLRVQYLTELYEPFEPFFSESKAPSEELLPAITRRTKQVPKPRKREYTLPLSEVLSVEDDVEQELYAARDSRRLRQLMGLPVNTLHSRRMMRIPSESDIIKTRHDLQLMLPPTGECVEDDRLEARDNSGVHNTPPAKKAESSNQANRREKGARLPDLVHWKALREDRLSDLAAPPSATSANQQQHSNKSKAKSVDQPDRQKTALPFFRGNFIVEGTRPRSQAYTQK